MWRNLEAKIIDAARRKIQSHESYRRAVTDENRRRTRRSTGSPELLSVRAPDTWALAAGFNPYHVRAHAPAIAHAMTRALRGGTWRPRRPAGFLVPKASGGTRLVSTFEIADEVISNQLLRSLSRKNVSAFSGRSYAYRADLTPHDAIRHIRTEFDRAQRLYIAEYDFRKFFDTIEHAYLRDALDNLRIIRTPLEESLIAAFLATPEPFITASERDESTDPRIRGLPQGTSISLFLANIAAAPLDRALEHLGVDFVRYADDTLIWDASYERVASAVNQIHQASSTIGSALNFDKSPGIRLLVPEGTKYSELRSTTTIDFLGHTLSLGRTRMKAAARARILARVQQLIYTNLLLEPLQGTQATVRIGQFDDDYVTTIWQLRRYLYGSLSEGEIQRMANGSIPPMSFKGVMSFFPLVDDEEELQQIDTWIEWRLWLALRKRARILAVPGTIEPVPWGLTRPKLRTAGDVHAITGDYVNLQIPSVLRIAAVIRKAVSAYGFAAVIRGDALYLYEQ